MLGEEELKILELAINELKLGVLTHLKEKKLKAGYPKEDIKGLNLRESVKKMYSTPQGLEEIKRYLRYQRELLRTYGGVFAILDSHPGRFKVYEDIKKYKPKTNDDPEIIIRMPKDKVGLKNESKIYLKYLFYDIKEILDDRFDVEVRKVLVPVNVILDLQEEGLSLAMISNAQKSTRVLENLKTHFDIEYGGFDYLSLSYKQINQIYSDFLTDILKKLEELNGDFKIEGPILTVDTVKVNVSDTEGYQGIRAISLEGGGISTDSTDEEFVGIFKHKKLQEILNKGGKIVEIKGTLTYIPEQKVIRRYKYVVGITRNIYPKFAISKSYAPDWSKVEREVETYKKVYSTLEGIFEEHFFVL